MKKITKETMKKMKEGKEKNSGIICKIDDIIISADQYQFIINDNGRYTYHLTIDEVLDELLEQKEKDLMIASKEKTLLSVQKAIQDSRKWLSKEVKPLLR